MFGIGDILKYYKSFSDRTLQSKSFDYDDNHYYHSIVDTIKNKSSLSKANKQITLLRQQRLIRSRLLQKSKVLIYKI